MTEGLTHIHLPASLGEFIRRIEPQWMTRTICTRVQHMPAELVSDADYVSAVITNTYRQLAMDCLGYLIIEQTGCWYISAGGSRNPIEGPENAAAYLNSQLTLPGMILSVTYEVVAHVVATPETAEIRRLCGLSEISHHK